MPKIRLDYISETVMIPHEEAGSSEQQKEKQSDLVTVCFHSFKEDTGECGSHLGLEFLLPVWQ